MTVLKIEFNETTHDGRLGGGCCLV